MLVVYSSRISMESGGMVVWVHLSLLAFCLLIGIDVRCCVHGIWISLHFVSLVGCD